MHTGAQPWAGPARSHACIVCGSHRHVEPSSPVLQCDAINGGLATETWSIRVSFWVYVIALCTTAGWLLFMIFCGVGLVALPLDLIREFLGRPRSTITKTEYLTRAKGLGMRAKDIMVGALLRAAMWANSMRQGHGASAHGRKCGMITLTPALGVLRTIARSMKAASLGPGSRTRCRAALQLGHATSCKL